jgi:phospholipid/cholesterol/gamma-HCH transport system substrate-binding protein
MPRKGVNVARVGLLVLAALAVLVVGLLLIGEQNQLFTRKNRYFILFANVNGLNTGSPVQLNGVDVGRVDKVVLPTEPSEAEIRVEISIDRAYAARVREDSMASIKTLGLLGDKYVELTSGSPKQPAIPDGGQITTSPGTSIDQLLASGENLMDNVIAISFSLRNVLGRMERGEGILGRLTVDTPEAESLIASVHEIVTTVEAIADKIDRGDGPLPRLINDRRLADQVASSVDRLERLLAAADEGEGALPKLLHDAETAERMDATLANLEKASADLAAFLGEVESSQGLLQRLLTDEEYGEQVATQVQDLIDRIDGLSQQLTEGDGTVAQLIEDPAVYQALKDVLVGINDSRILRWLIHNRQKKGIEIRYEDKVEEGEIEPIPPKREFPKDAPIAPPGDGEKPESEADHGGATP